jgi:hypothetical protein
MRAYECVWWTQKIKKAGRTGDSGGRLAVVGVREALRLRAAAAAAAAAAHRLLLLGRENAGGGGVCGGGEIGGRSEEKEALAGGGEVDAQAAQHRRRPADGGDGAHGPAGPAVGREVVEQLQGMASMHVNVYIPDTLHTQTQTQTQTQRHRHSHRHARTRAQAHPHTSAHTSDNTCRPERRSPTQKSGQAPGVDTTAASYSCASMRRVATDTWRDSLSLSVSIALSLSVSVSVPLSLCLSVSLSLSVSLCLSLSFRAVSLARRPSLGVCRQRIYNTPYIISK